MATFYNILKKFVTQKSLKTKCIESEFHNIGEMIKKKIIYTGAI